MALAATLPQSAWAENIVDAMIGAYNTSGLLEQQRAVLRAADEDVAMSLAALRPVLNWTTEVSRTLARARNSGVRVNSYETDFFTGLTLSQLLYDGGASVLGRQAAQETVLSTRQALLNIEQQILFRAASAYLNVVLYSENVRLRENNVRLLGEELRAAQDRFDVGEVTRTDVALAEAQLASARSSLASARGTLVSAQAEYVNATGHKLARHAGEPRLPKAAASQQAATDIAVRNHPSILSAQHDVKAAELAAQAASKAMGPSASLSASFGLSESITGDDYTHSVGIGASVSQPIYQGGALSANYRAALARRDAAKAALLSAQKDVIQGVANAYVRLEVAKANLISSAEQVRSAQVAFDGIREEAKLGARTTLDVLSAEQDLLDAQTNQISARSEEGIATYQLLQAQGLLTAERLGLAVQIYDPTLYYNLVQSAPSKVSKRSRDLDRVLKALGKQ
ncbi:TolC family outer membrane protein [Pseudodonghicola sp. IC7]|uniref:TolC family outer membrane protein n=1 Tax=Pseudodonghicola flavimaris TaxID=3050036 RepID=A0ABT7F5Y2_9RHOB|nr:TolC family outer membrane protein [Pseudodonghicola flavimaris]MDK3020017.1 TolC family outer membrane protein [Pseudodonghicola flavimaris]